MMDEPLPPVPPTPHLPPPMSGEIGLPPVGAASPIVPLAPEPGDHKKSKKGLLLGVGALAAVAIGGVAFVLARGDDAAQYSLQSAAVQAGAAKTVSYEMTITAGDEGDMTITAGVDNERKLTKMDMDIGELLGTGDGKLNAIIDAKSFVMYMGAGFFEQLGAPVGDAKWIKIDLNDESGVDFKALIDQSGDPLSTAKLFEEAKDVKDVGYDEVKGEKVKHYTVTVDATEALVTQPGLKKQLDDAGVEFPEEITYEVYVNEANQMRRISYELAVGEQTIAADVVVTGIDEPVDVELPAESDSVDLADLGG